MKNGVFHSDLIVGSQHTRRRSIRVVTPNRTIHSFWRYGSLASSKRWQNICRVASLDQPVIQHEQLFRANSTITPVGSLLYLLGSPFVSCRGVVKVFTSCMEFVEAAKVANLKHPSANFNDLATTLDVVLLVSASLVLCFWQRERATRFRYSGSDVQRQNPFERALLTNRKACSLRM